MNGWIQAFLFFLPAGVANATPVLANRIPGVKNWKMPMDFGKSWHGKRLLGPNKTWRGVFTGSLIGGLTGVLIFAAIDNGRSLAVSFLLSLVMGFGALLGDAVESSIKRRRGHAAGQSWFPFDQIDYIIGGLVAVYFFTSLAWEEVAQIIVLFFGLHLLTAYLAYLVGLKDKPI
jgi:CDP-2,3-bis-(O-geranylgeranyl)-sn-glycerol synthase